MPNKWFAMEGWLDPQHPARQIDDFAFRAWVALHQYVAEHLRPLPTEPSLAAACLGLSRTKVARVLPKLIAAALIREGEINGERGYVTTFTEEDVDRKIDLKIKRSSAGKSGHDSRRNIRDGYKTEQKPQVSETFPKKLPAPDGEKINQNKETSTAIVELLPNSLYTGHGTRNTGHCTPQHGTTPVEGLSPLSRLSLTSTSEQDAARVMSVAEWTAQFLAAYPPHPSGVAWPDTPLMIELAVRGTPVAQRERLLAAWTETYQSEWVNVPAAPDLADGASAHVWDRKQKRRPEIEAGCPVPPSAWLRRMKGRSGAGISWAEAFVAVADADWLFQRAAIEAACGDYPKPSPTDLSNRQRLGSYCR